MLTTVLTNEPVVTLLKRITKLVEENKLKELEKYTFSSPAGDGWGMENICIDFSSLMGESYKGEPLDFGDVLRMLTEKQELKKARIKELQAEIRKTEAL